MELKHYGVLGMKWGIRKAEKKGREYSYKSKSQKKLEKMIRKLSAFGNTKYTDAMEFDIDVFKERDRARIDYAKSVSTGKEIARKFFLGLDGAETYSKLSAAGIKNGRILLSIDSIFSKSARTEASRLEFNAAKERLEKRRGLSDYYKKKG